MKQYEIQINKIVPSDKDVLKKYGDWSDRQRIIKTYQRDHTGNEWQSNNYKIGKVIGAVTHVMINDPTRGYGILAENMLKSI